MNTERPSEYSAPPPDPGSRIPDPVYFPLLLLVALAAFLRFHGLDLVHFNIDEGTASAIAKQIATGRYFPLTGLETSFGFHNPPLLFYLLAIPYALSNSPLVAQGFVAALGVAAVPVIFAAGRALGGARLGLLAAALLAVCPNAVDHSRRLWGHDFIVFFGSMAMWGALAWWRDRTPWPLAASFAAAALAQSLHLSGILLWLPGLTAMVLAKFVGPRGSHSKDETPTPPEEEGSSSEKISAQKDATQVSGNGQRTTDYGLRPLLIGLLVLILSYLPWLVNEVRTGGESMGPFLAALRGGTGRELGLAVRPWAAWTMLLGDFWNNDALGTRRPFQVGPLAAVASAVLSVLALAGLAAGLAQGALLLKRRGCRSAQAGAAMILVVPLLAAPLLFGGLVGASVPPYQLPALPAAVLAAAWPLGRAPGKGAWPLVGIYGLAAVALLLAVRGELAAGGGTAPNLREKRAAVQAIAALSQPHQFAVLQDGRAPGRGIDVAYVYLLYAEGANERARGRAASASHLFVIHHQSTRLRPPVAAILGRFPVVLETGSLRVFLVPKEARSRWLQALERFPATGPGSQHL